MSLVTNVALYSTDRPDGSYVLVNEDNGLNYPIDAEVVEHYEDFSNLLASPVLVVILGVAGSLGMSDKFLANVPVLKLERVGDGIVLVDSSEVVSIMDDENPENIDRDKFEAVVMRGALETIKLSLEDVKARQEVN